MKVLDKGVIHPNEMFEDLEYYKTHKEWMDKTEPSWVTTLRNDIETKAGKKIDNKTLFLYAYMHICDKFYKINEFLRDKVKDLEEESCVWSVE
jgi:hypothetical protein